MVQDRSPLPVSEVEAYVYNGGDQCKLDSQKKFSDVYLFASHVLICFVLIGEFKEH